MDIPGWVFVLVGTIVAAISFIIYANTGTFQLFIAIGMLFLVYGLGKMVVAKMRAKNEDKINKEMAKFSQPTTFKDLPIGQEYYRQQLGQRPAQPAQWGHPMQQNRPQHRTHHAANPHTQAHTNTQMHTERRHTQAHPQYQHASQQAHRPAHPAHPQYHSPYAYCRACGARNHANVNFCGNCGGRMR